MPVTDAWLWDGQTEGGSASPRLAKSPFLDAEYTVHATYLQTRWNAGCRDATVLWQELRARGFTGSLRMVQRAVAGWRVEPARRARAAHIPGPTPALAPPQLRPPSPRQAVWWLLRPSAALEPAQRAMRAKLLAAAPEVRAALVLLEEFRRVVRERDGAAWERWLRVAETSPIREVKYGASRPSHGRTRQRSMRRWRIRGVRGKARGK